MKERITIHVGTNGKYWQCHWTDRSGRRRRESLGYQSSVSRRQATALARRIEDRVNSESEEAATTRPNITLQEFLDLYFTERTRAPNVQTHRRLKRYAQLGASTITLHRMTGRYLVKFFGPDRPLSKITKLDALQWLKALETGRLAGARNSTNQKYKALSEQSICKEIRNVKTIFGWAAAYEIITRNPFSEFMGAPAETHGSGHHVSIEDFEKLRTACLNHGWVTLLGLCRLAGLRRGEALNLVWSGKAVDRDGTERWVGVNLALSRLSVVAVKTGKYRQVPIVPALRTILTKQYAESVDGEELVVPEREVSRNNVRARVLNIVKRAELEQWPKLFQTLRSSCENQWKTEGVAEATYSAWLGHSVAVSRKHYVQPLDSEFDQVTGGGLRLAGKLSQKLSQNAEPGVDRKSRRVVNHSPITA